MIRAVRLHGPGDLAVREVPRPEPAADEVLVTVVASGICATDRKFAARGAGEQPRTLGHEVTGRLPDGSLIGIHPEVTCDSCPACRTGWQNRCPDRTALGLDRDGGLAEMVAVPAAQVLPLTGLDPVVAAMLEPLACAVHAVDAGIGPAPEPDTPAVVVGAGTMGILCAWVLRAAGYRVGVCQRSPARRRLARTLGADAAFDPGDDPTPLLGAPPAVVMVTAPGAEPLRWALTRTAVGGLVHAFAGSPGGAPVDANQVHYRHLRLIGSTGSRRADFRRARDLVTTGEVPLHRLPHRVVDLAAAPWAVREPAPDGVLKTVVAVATGGPA